MTSGRRRSAINTTTSSPVLRISGRAGSTTTNAGSFATKSAAETLQLGRQIGSQLVPNDVIALTGELGAGKTTLIQGIAEGAGVKDYVTSPTFIIINEYNALPAGRQGRLPFYHVDLYRLDTLEDIEELGIEEYFNKGGICVIEWAEKLGGLLPAEAERIVIEQKGENEREICVSSDLVARLKS